MCAALADKLFWETQELIQQTTLITALFSAKDAVRAIRKRLHTNMCKNNAIVMYTLTVLETCVKNCGHNFHVLVCSKDFVQDLVKLIGSKFDTPQIIHERVLSLIQVWFL